MEGGRRGDSCTHSCSRRRRDSLLAIEMQIINRILCCSTSYLKHFLSLQVPMLAYSCVVLAPCLISSSLWRHERSEYVVHSSVVVVVVVVPAAAQGSSWRRRRSWNGEGESNDGREGDNEKENTVWMGTSEEEERRPPH